MPRYFFDIHDGIVELDHQGMDLPDDMSARAHAMQVGAAYAGNPAMLGSDGGAVIVEVRNAARVKWLTMRLAFGIERH